MLCLLFSLLLCFMFVALMFILSVRALRGDLASQERLNTVIGAALVGVVVAGVGTLVWWLLRRRE